MMDHAELDFGIYRIMNQKRDEITRFLERELLPQVKEVLAADSAEIEAAKKRMAEITTQLGTNIDSLPENIPMVKEYKQLQSQLADSADSDDMQADVFSHLVTFFSRYYDGGDFLSKRRYKDNTYAIPYNGEEVKLYWANADQYYIKTSEYFRDYTFVLPTSKKKVHFVLKDASTEQNNNRNINNMERRFALYEPQTVEETVAKVDENGEFNIYFSYELMPKTTKQKDLNTQAFGAIRGRIPAEFSELLSTAPTANDANRTLLEKHLTDYTAKNSFDYFIHKDLGGFLSRELDFYIKNEVLHVDDLSVKFITKQLTVVRAIKEVGLKIIRMLAQLENFQKRLWLKKKFVVQCDYCITLDRVPKELYPEIAANDAQREEWVKWLAINETQGSEAYSEPLTVEFLKQNPFLVLDTACFTADFKHRLLRSIDNLDEQTDGLLVHSENFQAQELLQEKYQQRVKCIYIDPPYNTGNDGFVYKDGYNHSSWLTMMKDRLEKAKVDMPDDGVIFISIDDKEQVILRKLCDDIFGADNFVAQMIWEQGRKSMAAQIAVNHEYCLIYCKNRIKCIATDDAIPNHNWSDKKEGLEKIYSEFDRLKMTYHTDIVSIERGMRSFFRGLPESDPAKRQSQYKCVDGRGLYFPGDIAQGTGNGGRFDILHPVTHRPCKVPAGGWRFSESKLPELLRENRIHFGADDTTVPCLKRYLKETEYEVASSVFYKDGRGASKRLQAMFNSVAFDYPKDENVISRFVSFVTSYEGVMSDAVILDFFAGSGTTGHAVINLNREDGGKRKYILVEMGEYFNSVTKPRIEKVIYSKDWNNGKPVSREGSSHCFKYMRLEQYEDTLNNLAIKRDSTLFEHGSAFKESYILDYMLDTETRDSLLNMKLFENPFAVTMKTTRDNELVETPVDLVETFNYLIGLNVEAMSWHKNGNICTVEGVTHRDNLKTLVIWRNVKEVSNDDLNGFFRSMDFKIKSTDFDVIYVNGDNTLPNLRRDDGSDGEHWKVVLTEEEFAKRMFEED